MITTAPSPRRTPTGPEKGFQIAFAATKSGLVSLSNTPINLEPTPVLD